MIEQFKSKQFLVFLLTGGVAAVVNFCSRIVYNQWFSYSMAIVLAYLMGMVTAFVLAKLFVFQKSTQSMQRTMVFFALVNGVAVVQTWGISMLLAHYFLPWMGLNQYVKELAHAIGVVVPVFTSYLGHKRFSFK